MCHICQGMSWRDVLGVARSKILELGFTTMHIHGQGRAIPSFGYTVGLSRLDRPELIVFGSAHVEQRPAED